MNRQRNSRQPIIRKFLPQYGNKLLPHLMLIIILVKCEPLCQTSVPPYRAHIHHPIPKLDKRASLDGNIEIRHVMQHELDELLVFLLAEPADEGLRCNGSAELEGCEAVFREAEVEEGGYADGGRAELFLLFGEV